MDFLEYPDVAQEVRGSLHRGRLKMTNQALIFKFNKTGKVDQIQGTDIEAVYWQRMAGQFGLRLSTKNNQQFRFCCFKEVEFDKLVKFFDHNYSQTLEEKQLSIKGWNWGVAKFAGSVLSFEVDRHEAFSLPLTNVSHCTTAKNEVTLEFQQNDDAAVSLMELRFHIPNDASEVDPAQAFHNNVMQKANIIQATGDAIATFQEIQCLTPRGRYDIKLFPTFIQLHGKTFDYKIPLTTILRLFLLPHKDQRQMYFVVSVDPPIKQGQTRYHFLILLFNNEEEVTIDVAMSEKDLEEKYEGKLQQQMTGLTYEIMSKMMKAFVNRKITVPGGFTGHSGTAAVSCSYKAAAGFMYPLERGLIYVYKPPIYIRFEEIDGINFARSGGSTRTFDFEVEIKNGIVHTFSSIEKDEYTKLFDFIKGKKLRVKNRGQMGKQGGGYKEDLVDSDQEAEPDAYLARVKAEAEERDDDAGDDSDESTDESFNPGEGSGSEVAEEFDSNASSSSSEDEEGGGGGEGKEKKRKHKDEKKKPKKAKTVPEGKPRKERKPKKEKDENRPKRAQSAYFLWLNENRENLKKEFPGIAITELSKKAGIAWKELTDKSKWEKLAGEEKKKYEEAMAEYKASGGGEASGSKSPKKSKTKSTPKSKSSPKKESPQKGSFKSKEYISSSEGSSDDDDKKKKKSKPTKKKTPVKKEKAKSSSDEAGDDDDEEEKKTATTPASSEAEDKADAKSEKSASASGSASEEDSD